LAAQLPAQLAGAAEVPVLTPKCTGVRSRRGIGLSTKSVCYAALPVKNLVLAGRGVVNGNV
jgi:hypothetical protein